MEKIALGTQGLEASRIGLGCMGMTWAYRGAEEAECLRALSLAVERGITLFDTAEVYGPYANEELLGRALAPFGEEVLIATKFGFRIDLAAPMGVGGLDSRPENVRAAAEGSLRRLGRETIDVLYQHRLDPGVPIEETVGAMAELVREGKVRYLGLCEVSPGTVRRAHSVHPISVVQSEYSLWSRDVERDLLPVLRELGIGFVAYSPLGRGFLAGSVRSRVDLDPDDWRLTQPRFTETALAKNRGIARAVDAMAQEKGCTPAQLALAWLLAQGEDVVPIPGTSKASRIEENAAAAGLVLTAEEVDRLGTVIPRPVGARYDEAMMAAIDGQHAS